MAEFQNWLVIELFSRILRISGICYLLRKCTWRNRAAILLYHDPKPNILDAHLAYVKRIARIVSLPELWDSFCDEPLAVITIDDGAIGNLELKEVFQKHGVKPMLYLCTGTISYGAGFWWRSVPSKREVERLKTLDNAERKKLLYELGFEETKKTTPQQAIPLDQLSCLQEWADLGAHSRFHPILTRCTDDECQKEISESKDEFLPLGIALSDFAFPNGDYSDREVDFVKAAGFRSARTCDAGWNGPQSDRFRLKCFVMDDRASVDKLAVVLTGIPAFVRRIGKKIKTA